MQLFPRFGALAATAVLTRGCTLLFALFSIGCASQPLYQRVNFAEPNPFTKPGCKLTVERINADHLIVEGRPEGEWLAGKTPQQQSSYQQDKLTGEARFDRYLRKKRTSVLAPVGTTGDNVFVLKPAFNDWDPGQVGFGANAAKARMVFDVLDSDGRVVDEFTYHGGVAAYSTGERMWGALEVAGWAVDEYLRDRWACAAN
jgi:hypothetical protein